MRVLQGISLTLLFIANFALAAPPALAAKPTTPKATPAKAQAKKAATTEKLPTIEEAIVLPEVLGTKTFLEDMMVRRYSSELATLVDKQAFSMGAQLDLISVDKAVGNETDDDYPPDLLLGTIDPEQMLKRYTGSDSKSWAEGFLQDYRIKSVSVSVGLKPELGPEAKATVEKWLTERLSTEFGKLAKGGVSFISTVKEKVPPQKSFTDWLSQFQTLAGELLLALGLLLGVIVWKLLVSRDVLARNEKIDHAQKNVPQVGMMAHAPGASLPSVDKKEDEQGDEKSVNTKTGLDVVAEANAEIKQLSRRLIALIPSVSDRIDSIIRTWCQSGDEGKLKLACFAEAAGKSFGKIQIPVDALEELSKIFKQMPDINAVEKRKILKKVYWDFLSSINLGMESLEQPFSYFNQLTNTMVDKVLIDQNPKMKAVVMLHMPAQAREKFLKSLSLDAKRELVDAAFQMIELPATEVKSFDDVLKDKIRTSGPAKSIVSIKPLLNRLIDPLTPSEEINILGGLSGPAIHDFRRTYPSLAFIGNWPDDKLSLLLARAMPEELLAFVRLRPEMKDRILSLTPTMTAEILTDELARPDTMNTKDKDALLGQLAARLKEMIRIGEVDLEEIFVAETPSIANDAVKPDPESGGAAPTDQGGTDAGSGQAVA